MKNVEKQLYDLFDLLDLLSCNQSDDVINDDHFNSLRLNLEFLLPLL